VGSTSSTSPREQKLLAAAAAATALHVLDDATLHREPGTTVADHLIGAGALLAVLAVAAAVFPRLRAAPQGVLALLLGLLATTYGGLALAEVVLQERLSVGDVTGLLCLPAGLLALAVGARILWRGRRREGSRARRYARRALIGVAGAVAAYMLVFPVLLAIGLTNKPRAEVEAADLGRPYEAVTLPTSDGLDLAGWYVPSENGAAVIAFPGRSGPVPHARMLVRHGYGVLLLDMRGNGESEGEPNAFGWGSARDVAAAVSFLRERDDVERGRIGGLGLSVGGELLLQAAAEGPGLDAVVSEGAGYRTMREYLEQPGGASWVTAPQLATLFGTLRLLAHERPPAPLYDLVGRIAPRPILLIEAGHGQGGETLNGLYFERAGEPKEHWLIPEADHVGGLEARPAEYERRVVGFFDGTLLGRG
jgi:fermentation-respiration switch protein FrsA (DUF1100 family)